MGEGRQVPTAGCWSQRSQLPVQGVVQHTPFAQTPEVHWGLVVQPTPASLVGWHCPELQNVPFAHCRPEVHSVGQLACPSQTKGAHDDAVPSGSTAQVPSRPACAHDSHAPVQARSQHTPCAQTPDAQGTPMTQGWPVGIGVTEPPPAEPPAALPPAVSPPAEPPASPPAAPPAAPPAEPPAASPPAAAPPPCVPPPCAEPPPTSPPPEEPAVPPAPAPPCPPSVDRHDAAQVPSQQTPPSVQSSSTSHRKRTCEGSTQRQPAKLVSRSNRSVQNVLIRRTIHGNQRQTGSGVRR